MAEEPGRGFTPSKTALEFGDQYAEVLEHWAGLFNAAAGLVRANVALGKTAADASSEFEEWMQTTASGPLTWFNPEAMQRFMRTMAGAATGAGPAGGSTGGRPESGPSGPGHGPGRMK